MKIGRYFARGAILTSAGVAMVLLASSAAQAASAATAHATSAAQKNAHVATLADRGNGSPVPPPINSRVTTRDIHLSQDGIHPMSCKYFDTDTGSGLNMTTALNVCGTGNYVNWAEGWVHNNSGSYAHTGYVHLSFSNGENYYTDWQTVPPNTSSVGATADPNKNYSSGTRVCSNWVKENGAATSGYACATIG